MNTTGGHKVGINIHRSQPCPGYWHLCTGISKSCTWLYFGVWNTSLDSQIKWNTAPLLTVCFNVISYTIIFHSFGQLTRGYFICNIKNLHTEFLLLHNVLLVHVELAMLAFLLPSAYHLAKCQFDIHQVVVVGVQILRVFFDKTLAGLGDGTFKAYLKKLFRSLFY